MQTLDSNFSRNAARVSWFALISYAVDYSFQLVDIFWVAKVGPGAPTALSILSSVLFLTLALNEIVGVGTVALFSRAFGSGDMNRTGEVITQALILKGLLGLGMASVFLIYVSFGLGHYPVDLTTHAYMREYGMVIWASLVVVPIYSTLMTALRCTRREASTAVISILALVINAALNPMLIFGFGPFPPLGVAGSAYATVFAQVFALIAAGVWLTKGSIRFPVMPKDTPRLELSLFTRLIKIGLPIGGVAILYNLEQAIITGIIATFPQAVSDGYGVAARVYGFMFMATFGIASGVSVTVGQFIGLGRLNDIQTSLPRFAAWCTLAMAVPAMSLFFLAPSIVSQFTENPTSIAVGATYLRFMTIGAMLLCVLSSINGAFEGAGNNIPVLFVALTSYLCVEAPILLIIAASSEITPKAIWWATLSAVLFSVIVSAWLFSRRRWHPNF
ncbi:putative MATE family efflux protein [Rhizobium soli]|uniref:Multidrug-efflux transporter n=1 Tax=Rhizobium soli TaxID=424798 RepID=A0A7X0JMX4_9HYPH|nr:MATE family efflux transporter [Rhizobium soli]MBB6510550.1 putative MATE family efflux protein [Rhizobium soli]